MSVSTYFEFATSLLMQWEACVRMLSEGLGKGSELCAVSSSETSNLQGCSFVRVAPDA